MRNSPPSREEVLDTLASRLDDALLAELFPSSPPAAIRALVSGRAPAEASGTEPTPPPPPVQQEKRTAMAKERCRLFTDGASRGNPGQAGAGIVLFDQQGEELLSYAKYLGTCTNNVAEYQALIIGLEQALAAGCRQLEIFLDSQLIVYQIQGRYRVKNETLKPLYARVLAQLKGLDNWSVAHVPRARNKRADELANLGIDQQG
ncbi:ribonuclease HI family protein [Desulfogranum mediterraneum]|uniref:ribonuclease HI family protein n=1 Tax=Desulfogranum mediterraneum TaxID=160661 RepID=UPI0004118108|nr:ribonuclease HI family protein [Desulfogranum mediterraneum]